MNIKKQLLVWLSLFLLIGIAIPTMAEDVNTEVLSDFDVFEADIKDVFRSLAEIGDINILFDPTVKGNVTIKLKHGLKIKEAIELLAQTYGYSYRWIAQSRTVLIGDEKNFANFETKETKTYKLNYAKPEDVAKSLETIVAKERIGTDQRTNQITIRASVLEHQNILDIVKRLDREMPQINIEAKLQEFSSSDVMKLGVLWEPDAIKTAIPIGRIDPYVTLTPSMREALSKGKLIANPNISTTDSQEGKICIGEKVPIVTKDEDDGKVTYKIEYIEIGTILTIIPRINEDNIVTVTVKAEISDISEWKNLGNGDQAPLVRTREASSVIRLKEGETFALSGLKQISSKKEKTGIPFLSRIPILGYLFATDNDEDLDKELIIFLTPRIVYSEKYLKEKQREEEEAAAAAAAAEQSAATTDETPVKEEPKPAEPAVTDVEEEEYAEPAVADDLSEEPEQQDLLANDEPEANNEVKESTYSTKYTVKSRETLAGIASKFGISTESISQANNLGVNAKLNQGQVLNINVPEEHLYRIKAKDTLWRLSKRYGTTVNNILEINNMSQNTVLEIDQILILPVAVDNIADSNF